MLIPPAMILAPALFPNFAKLASFVVGLLAVPPMMLDRFMQFVLGMFDPMLAPFIDRLARLGNCLWNSHRGHQCDTHAHRPHP
jgi:hypothetical protein